VAGNSFSFRVDKPQNSPWTKIYHYQKRYFTFDLSVGIKIWRLWPLTGSNDFFSTYSHGGGAAAGNEIEPSINSPIGGYQGFVPAINQWHTDEFIWQYSGGNGLNTDNSTAPCNSTGNACGIWDYTIDGVLSQHRENVDNGANTQVQLRTDNYTGPFEPPDYTSKVYIDNIYIDDTYARIMIGNASTWAASTIREIQIPSAWSGTSITVTLNQGSFNSLSGTYLYVFDANNTANAVGFPLTGGGGGGGGTSGPMGRTKGSRSKK
jgi:hypothetical protein